MDLFLLILSIANLIALQAPPDLGTLIKDHGVIGVLIWIIVMLMIGAAWLIRWGSKLFEKHIEQYREEERRNAGATLTNLGLLSESQRLHGELQREIIRNQEELLENQRELAHKVDALDKCVTGLKMQLELACSRGFGK